MWNPTCYGDPGKVSDAEYHCDHRRRRWRAQQLRACPTTPTRCSSTVAPTTARRSRASASTRRRTSTSGPRTTYLTPTSDFIDHADSPRGLLRRPGGQADQQAVSTEAARTPVRRDRPDHCGRLRSRSPRRSRPWRCGPTRPRSATGSRSARPPNAPSICGDGFVTRRGVSRGLRGRPRRAGPRSRRSSTTGGFGGPWEAPRPRSRRPRRWRRLRSGARPTGECSGDGRTTSRAATRSSAPTIELPGRDQAPRLSFDHYVATEAAYDGGNVKVQRQRRRLRGHPGGGLHLQRARRHARDRSRAATPTRWPARTGFTGTDGGRDLGLVGPVAGRPVQAAGVKAGRHRPDPLRHRSRRLWRRRRLVRRQHPDPGLRDSPTKVTATSTCPSPRPFGKASTVNVTVARDGNGRRHADRRRRPRQGRRHRRSATGRPGRGQGDHRPACRPAGRCAHADCHHEGTDVAGVRPARPR